ENIIAKSPFNYERNVLFVVPDHLPVPGDEAFGNDLAELVRDVIERAQGRTLVLFTSRRSMQRTREHRVFRDCPHRILCQDEMPPLRLAEEFRNDTSSSLFGLERFWAGLDVPGDSLSVVIIEKIPFPNPDDPIIDALCDGAQNGFAKHSIPRAAILFKQGFGRLIRTMTDRGVVICCDRRILEKGYGRAFMNSI